MHPSTDSRRHGPSAGVAWGCLLLAALWLPPAAPGQAPEPPATSPAADPAALGDLGPPRPDADRLWTVLVYLNSDNNLEPLGLRDFNQLEAALPETGVEILVLQDRAAGFAETEEDWTGARLYRIRRDTDAEAYASELLKDLGEANLGDPATLEHFIAGALRAFPAAHRALVLWDHGAGWPVASADDQAGGGEGGADLLTMFECREAMTRGLERAGAAKFDLTVFYACQMGQLEVASFLEGRSDVVVASEAVVPYIGLVFPGWVPALGRTGEAQALAVEIIKAYAAQLEKDRLQGTLAAYDMTRLTATLEAFDALVGKLAEAAEEQWPAFSRTLYFSENYEDETMRYAQRMGRAALCSIDLLDWLKRLEKALGADFPAAAELAAFRQAAGQFILAECRSPQRTLSEGLAVYAPFRKDMVKEDYPACPLAQRTAWAALLARMHRGQQRELTTPSVPELEILDEAGRPTTEVRHLGRGSARFVVEGNNLLWTTVSVGRVRTEPPLGEQTFFEALVLDVQDAPIDGQAVAAEVDALTPRYAEGRTELRRELTGMCFALSNGETSAVGTLFHLDPNRLRLAEFAVLYRDAEIGTVRATARVHVSSHAIVSLTGHVPLSGGGQIAFPLKPKPEGEIVPLTKVTADDGGVRFLAEGAIPWGQGLRMIVLPMPEGQYRLRVQAESIAPDRGVSRPVTFHLEANPALAKLTRLDSPYRGENLLGTWETFLVQDGADGQPVEVATGRTLRFHVEARSRRLLCDVDSEQVQATGIVVLHDAFFPVLEVHSDQVTGRMEKLAYWFAFYLLENRRPTIFVFDPASGARFLLRPKGPMPPLPPPPPLYGQWRAGGALILFNETQYAAYDANAQLIDQGTYRLADDAKTLTLVNAQDETETITVNALEGDRLTITDPDGEQAVFQRISRTLPQEADAGTDGGDQWDP